MTGVLVGAAVLGAVFGYLVLLPLLPPIQHGGGSAGPPTAGGPPPKTVGVQLFEFDISPEQVEVAAETELVFNVRNTGDNLHDFKIEGEVGTDRLNPGDSAVVEAGQVTAPFKVWCTVTGHRELGMELEVIVTDGGEE